MKSILPALPWAVLLLAPWLHGADPTSAPRDPHEPVLELRVDDETVLLAIDLSFDGRPSGPAWDTWLERLFADLDANQDGALSAAEARRAPASRTLFELWRGQLEAPPAVLELKMLDRAPQDGQVSLAEFFRAYREAGVGRIELLPIAPGASGG
jgi:hypothetical protein